MPDAPAFSAQPSDGPVFPLQATAAAPSASAGDAAAGPRVAVSDEAYSPPDEG